MSLHQNSTASLFAIAGASSYARFKVWKDSARAPVPFAPIGANRSEARRSAARLYHNARRYERSTRRRGLQDGAIGRNGLAILHAMLFDFLNHSTGQLDPSYDSIARAANISVRSVARGLQRLRKAKVLHWVRRCREDRDMAGRWILRQESNAYAIAPATQWNGFHPPADPPAPQPGTWGDQPPMPDALGQAADELRAGAGAAAIQRTLERGDGLLSPGMARLGRNRTR